MADEQPLPSLKERDIFFEAIQKTTPAARDAYLAEACGDNLQLLASIKSLLQQHEEGKTLQKIESDFLNKRASISDVADTIDRFKLLDQLGEGGSGTVYRAEQLQPFRRIVAIKILRWGTDSRKIVRRFEEELQTLANLDHPCIAKIYDAGQTSSGRPFFAMELVDGIKITDYANQHNLSIGQRCELFLKVCGAIQHAHSKGIIHRDIKPSNILVHEQGNEYWPKVIDFGIAKAIAGEEPDQTSLTMTGQVIGTPAYMSPEQARADSKIDERADIYSLGVLLYELMVDQLPFALEGKNLYEQLHAIINEAPLSPSEIFGNLNLEQQATIAYNRKTELGTLYNFLSDKLDCVVLRCLAKEPDKRYASIAELVAEIEYVNFSEGREGGITPNTKLSQNTAGMAAPSSNSSNGLWARLGRESITKAAVTKVVLAIFSVSFLTSWVVFPSFKTNGTIDLFVLFSCLFVIVQRWRYLLDGKWKINPISCAAVIVSTILLILSYPIIHGLVGVQHGTNDMKVAVDNITADIINVNKQIENNSKPHQ